MNSYKKLGKNVLLLTLGNFASKVLSFLLVPLYTAILTTSEYGTADIVTTTVNLVMPICTLSIFDAVLRFSLDPKSDRKQVFSIGLYTLIIGCMVITCAMQFTRLFQNLAPYVWYFVLYYISLAIYNLVLQFAKGIEKIGVYSITGVLNTAIYITCNILFLVILKIGVRGYLLSFILGHFISAIYAFFASQSYKYVIGFFKIKSEVFRDMRKYSVPMIPNSISWWVSNSSDKYVLTFFHGIAINGVYSVAYKIPSILTIVINIFISAWQISAVDDFGSEDSKRFFADVYDKYECILYIGAAFLVGLTKLLASMLYKKGFYDAWVFSPVLILASVFNSLAAFYGSIYTASKKTKMLFYSTLVGAGSNILLNFILIPKFAATGAAIATMVSYMIVWIMRVINSKQILKFNIKGKRNNIIYFVLFAETLLICFDINPFGLVSIISVFAVIYLCRRSLISIFRGLYKKRSYS